MKSCGSFVAPASSPGAVTPALFFLVLPSCIANYEKKQQGLDLYHARSKVSVPQLKSGKKQNKTKKLPTIGVATIITLMTSDSPVPCAD